MRRMLAMNYSLPQGTLGLDTAIERLARRKHPKLFVVERGDREEAWRVLCQLIVEKHISARILNESGDTSYEADCYQFLTLQERYIFVTPRPLRGFAEKEQRFLEIERPQTSEWRDANGTTHQRSRLFFLESDLAAVLGAEEAPQWLRENALPAGEVIEETNAAGDEAPDDVEAGGKAVSPSPDAVPVPDNKPFPPEREDELKAFLVDDARKQKRMVGRNNDEIALAEVRRRFPNMRIQQKLLIYQLNR
jgi:hypothetical protein